MCGAPAYSGSVRAAAAMGRCSRMSALRRGDTDAPCGRRRCLAAGPRQFGDEALSRDYFGAEKSEMSRCNLAVDQAIIPLLQLRDQMHERHFGRVVAAGEHRLTEKHLADGNTIQSADQFVSVPTFRRMGVTQPVQLAIGSDHLGGEPSAAAVAARGGAGGDDRGESGAVGDAVFALAQRFPQAAAYVQTVGI